MNLFFVFWMSQKRERRKKIKGGGGVKWIILEILGFELRLACLATLKTLCLGLNPRICEEPELI